jgi:hypothetical protein
VKVLCGPDHINPLYVHKEVIVEHAPELLDCLDEDLTVSVSLESDISAMDRVSHRLALTMNFTG